MTKHTKWHVCPSKTQTSLGIRPVWSEFSLSAWRKLGSLTFFERTMKDLIRLGGCPGWSESSLDAQSILAHLSRRLTRWAYNIPMVRRPSVVRRRPHFQTWISLKPVGQSWSMWFMCSITGVGERLHKVFGQIGSKLWFLWQQKTPIDL